MGFVYVHVQVRRVGSKNVYEAKFLVDTGASDTLVPAKELRRLGVRPAGTKEYELADGSICEFEFGLAEIRIEGEITAGQVLFGPDEAEPVLGVLALQSARLLVDPVRHEIRKVFRRRDLARFPTPEPRKLPGRPPPSR